ncbi:MULTISPECIES: hypothetical protein [unclassified Psychrobacter]
MWRSSTVVLLRFLQFTACCHAKLSVTILTRLPPRSINNGADIT